MQSSNSATKLKKVSSGGLGSHLTTYQGQIIRQSTMNTIKKQKSNRRVITQHSEKGLSITSQLKKATKQFQLPFKSISPKLKKNIIDSNSNSNNKLCFASTKLNRKKQIKPFKTQTGGLIKKKKIAPSDKKLIFAKQEKTLNLKQQKHHQKQYKQSQKKQQKKQEKLNTQYPIQKKLKVIPKKLKQSKSQTQLTEYHKMRLKTQGTFDSTPATLGSHDVQIIGLIGQGTFGKVYKGKISKTNELVAIKKVFQDPKYKNRQIQIVSLLDGEFVMKVLGTFTTVQNGNQYLNIIMNYYDGDLYNFIKNHGKKGLTTFDIKLITYQIFRGLMYIHSLGICHRDIKPHNILIKGKNIVLCDFGSAKIITNQPNLPYICSRCYRAPQLIFGATHYSTMIDIWSVGCVILQMINGMPLFIGQSSIDHLIQIIKVMGTPTKTQVIDMNPQYDLNDYKFPKIKKKEWLKIFPKSDQLLLDLIGQILIYSPKQRLNAAEALTHQFFDQLRDEKTYKHIQKQFNLNLFQFSQKQLKGNQHLVPKLIPQWIKF